MGQAEGLFEVIWGYSEILSEPGLNYGGDYVLESILGREFEVVG